MEHLQNEMKNPHALHFLRKEVELGISDTFSFLGRECNDILDQKHVNYQKLNADGTYFLASSHILYLYSYYCGTAILCPHDSHT